MAETERVVGREQHQSVNSTTTPEIRHLVDHLD